MTLSSWPSAPAKNNTSSWSGIAVYGAYDWTKSLRTVLRLEYFADPQAVRNGITAPGHNVNSTGSPPPSSTRSGAGSWASSSTGTTQASRNAFSLEDFSTKPTSRSQDTFSIALQYSFF